MTLNIVQVISELMLLSEGLFTIVEDCIIILL